MPGVTPDSIETVLKGNNIEFSRKEIQHGCQFVFSDGAILCAYNSGKTNWAGKAGASRERVSELLGEPIQVPGLPSSFSKAGESEHKASNKVFVVYGHDSEAREQLELILRRMRLEPVVLQNLPIGGQTIIEKLESNTDVRYACVLLTPDDEGYRVGKPDEKRPRARQNVVLELGMFLAALGRKKVAVLHKGELELPSDINGLIYIKFEDRVDEVSNRLGAELQEAGFNINIKDLLC